MASSSQTTSHSLTEQELGQYHEQGFFVKRNLVDADTMTRVMTQVDGLHEKVAQMEAAGKVPEDVDPSWEVFDESKSDKKLIRQLMGSEILCPAIDQITRSDAMLDIMVQLIGPDVYLFHSKLMMKGAYDGTFTPWHQDWGYWQHGAKEPTQVNCMLAIDPSNEANGALRFVPGSHKQGAIDHKDTQTSSFNIGLDGDIDAYESVMVELNPGDGVFFGPLVIHGSAANNSPNNRRANTFAFDKPGNLLQGEYPDRNYRRGHRVTA